MKQTARLKDEEGAVLITSLILLLLLTLLGVASMQTTTLEEKMAGNLEQKALAFQAAEAGLRDAESWLNNTVILPDFDGTKGLYQPADVDETPNWKAVDWTSDTAVRTYQSADLGVTPPYPLPRYIIEFMNEMAVDYSDSEKLMPEPEDKQGVYRITSRGVSTNGRGEVILQTTFIR
jgi:type IV pilus assembly protein PilX